MTSGQWDLNALEALEREALEVVGVLEVPDHFRRCQTVSPVHHQHQPHHSHVFHRHVKPNHTASSKQFKELHSIQPNHAGCGMTEENVVSKYRPTVGCLIRCDGHSNEDGVHIELKDHIKHCSCTCNHMGYGNFMDYQVWIWIYSDNNYIQDQRIMVFRHLASVDCRT